MTLPKPYFQDEAVTIYHANNADILPYLSGIDLVLTDPPYGIGYVHGAEKHANSSRFNGVAVIGDDKPFDPTPLLQLAPDVVLWGANHYTDKLLTSRGWLVWDKRCNTVVNDQSDCEMAWTNRLKTARIFYHVWDGFRMGSEMGTKRVHPTQKPVALMKWCLGFFPQARLVLDPYMGSGTTLRACKDLGIKAIGIEISEEYCAIAARRMSQSVMSL